MATVGETQVQSAAEMDEGCDCRVVSMAVVRLLGRMDDGGLACFVLWRAQVCLVAKLAREKNEGPSTSPPK